MSLVFALAGFADGFCERGRPPPTDRPSSIGFFTRTALTFSPRGYAIGRAIRIVELEDTIRRVHALHAINSAARGDGWIDEVASANRKWTELVRIMPWGDVRQAEELASRGER